MQRAILAPTASLAFALTVMQSSTARAQQPGTSCAGRPRGDTLPILRKALPLHFSGPRFRPPSKVRLNFVVDSNGAVDTTSIRFVDSTTPVYEQDARRYAAGLTFWPGCRDGKAVRAQIVFPVFWVPPVNTGPRTH
jgi:hypothetical protein